MFSKNRPPRRGSTAVARRENQSRLARAGISHQRGPLRSPAWHVDSRAVLRARSARRNDSRAAVSAGWHPSISRCRAVSISCWRCRRPMRSASPEAACRRRLADDHDQLARRARDALQSGRRLFELPHAGAVSGGTSAIPNSSRTTSLRSPITRTSPQCSRGVRRC